MSIQKTAFGNLILLKMVVNDEVISEYICRKTAYVDMTDINASLALHLKQCREYSKPMDLGGV